MALGSKSPRVPGRHLRALSLVFAATVCGARLLAAQESSSASAPFTFVVLGHVRGNANGANPKLEELIDEVKAQTPDLVFLTGDMIWGDTYNFPVDTVRVTNEWHALDSALSILSADIYRTPGNHDINDQLSRDIYAARYGLPPARVSYGDSRFLLMNSNWVPRDEDDVPARRKEFIRGKDLDGAQIDFLRRELTDTAAFEHAFVFVHHLLWWDEDSPWWDTVHPILASGKVRAVFSGEYGPMKFSHMTRDGVAYYQASIEDDVSVAIQQARPSSWRLSSQFDNYLSVSVEGPEVEVAVHTIAETSSGAFTPQRWTDISRGEARPGLTSQVWNVIGSPKRLAALLVVAVAYSLLIVVSTRWLGARRTRGS